MAHPPTKTFMATAVAFALVACGGGDGGADGSSGPGAPQSDLSVSAVSPAHGKAGIAVTLTGSGFSTNPSDNVVTLNNKPCTVTAASASELTLTIPANAGSGNLQVTVLARTAQSPVFTYDLSFATVSTLAGEHLGYLDDVGTAAMFNAPTGVAFGAGGLLFVSDSANHRIRAVNAAGAVTTFAGSGVEGTADGAGTGPSTGPQFGFPDALAFDAAGNLFIADPGNNNIRKATSAATVTTFVGNGAGLSGPFGLAFDGAGNLYVADKGNHRILKVTPNGAVSTFAGSTAGAADGTGSAARFNFPGGLAFCGDGNLFVADQGNNEIRKITPAGVVSTYAGGIGGLSFVDGTLSQARFLAPRDLVCDSQGKLFVVDTGNERIRMITPSGMVSTLAGSTAAGFADGDGATARFSLPQHIALDKDGALLIADAANQRIRKIVWR